MEYVEEPSTTTTTTTSTTTTTIQPQPPPEFVRASFLWLHEGLSTLDLGSKQITDDRRREVLSWCLQNKDNTVYIILCSRDPRAPGTWLWKDWSMAGFGGEIDPDSVSSVNRILDMCLERGLAVWLWCIADDSSRYIPYGDTARLKGALKQMATLFDGHGAVIGWNLFLECDEYLKENQQRECTTAFQGWTDKPISVHYLPMRRDWGMRDSNVDVIFVQLGWVSSDGEFLEKSGQMIKDAGKPVNISEYDKESDQRYGWRHMEQLIEWGAHGYGTGVER